VIDDYTMTIPCRKKLFKQETQAREFMVVNRHDYVGRTLLQEIDSQPESVSN